MFIPTMKLVIGIIVFSGVLLLSQVAECALIFSVTEHCDADDNEPWSYHGNSNGPSEWSKTYPHCSGEKQSPVAITGEDVEPDPNLEKLAMNNYGTPITKAKIVNNGHSVEIVPEDGVSRSIVVEGKTFTLQQIHFHWGSTYYEGSEHTIDDQQYAMEGHLVHTTKKNEIAVVGVIFEEEDSENSALQPITNVLPKVPFKKNEAQLETELNLDDFVPDNPSSFYRYSGSLTTPGCNEGVIWSVLTGIQSVGAKQIQQFRNLYSAVEAEASPDCKLVNNFRPVQPLNDRVIYSSL